jgi:sucrose-6-phosphatase
VAKFLFVTDLDNTLVGDDDALERLNQQLIQHREEHGTVIVYATGRSLPLFEELRSEKPLIKPDLLVLAVGTEIYRQDGGTPDPTWASQLNYRWDREKVRAIAAQFNDLTPQSQTEQGPFKASYFLEEPASKEVLACLEAELKDQGLDAQLVYSSGHDLDILPKRANKGAAVGFLQQSFQIPKERTVVCGDSGNDLSMFQANHSRGIIVGNAQPELLNWHHENPSGDRYLAQSHCAGGILEGLKHFGFIS